MQKTFGEFLRQKRQEKNLTQRELSKSLFVSESAISKWEKDIAHPDITLLPKLAEILGVTEHELITASIDNKTREEKVQAKRWRTLSFTWSLFFYIAYAVALIPCFICNLAIDKTLSWFWIVLSALILAFTFTNLPKLIKKYKLVLIPLSEFIALLLLLGVCCVYTKGNWFWIVAISVLLGLVIIFLPIFIAKYKEFVSIKKYNAFLSIAIDFVLLNVLLLVINLHTLSNTGWWYFKIALPIALGLYILLNALLCVGFLKTNRFIKTSIILFLIDLILYLPPLFIKVKNPAIQSEVDDINILKANLSNWAVGTTIEQNVHLIIFLTTLLISIAFLVVGVVRNHRKNIAKNPNKN